MTGEQHPNRPTFDHGTAPRGGGPLLRLAVGLGDPERERRLLPALTEAGDLGTVARCLAGDELVELVQDRWADAVLVAFDLHRLTGTALAELVQTRVPLVLLAPDPDDPRWQALSSITLPLDASPETVRQALEAAVRGERPPASAPRPNPEPPPAVTAPAAPPTDALAVIAVASGHGSPGRTTVALNLAVALGAVAPTVLVDADLAGPSVAAYLDADPTRNLYMLAHAEPDSARDWELALGQELQPLAARCPQGMLLCGVPKPEMRRGISPRFYERLLAELQQRYRYVILDVGAELLGTDAALHRTAVRLAGQVLLVASADLVGLWHVHAALGVLQSHLQLPPERIALVVNRHDRRHHHSRSEIEWALGLTTAAVLPHDYGGIQRALSTQQPLVLDQRSRAGRSLLDLAGRLHGGNILLPPESDAARTINPLRQAVTCPLTWLRRANGRATGKGDSHGDRVVSAR